MNAHTQIDRKGIALANDVIGGVWPIGNYPIFTQSDWKHAAELALAANDYSDLLEMEAEQEEADREEEAERFAAHSGTAPNRRSWMECA